MVLVSTTFLVQNQYYATQIQRTGVHDNARASTELIASELRSVMEDGIVVAGARTLTIRTPIVTAIVCNMTGANADVYSIGGVPAIDTAEIAGAALRDTLTGGWNYGNAGWQHLLGTGGNPQDNCAANGADTVGFYDDFHRLRGLASVTGLPDEGDVLMLFRETTFTIAPSVMDTTTLGLFRTTLVGSTVEYATGLASTAQFQYRTGGSTYADTVVAANLGEIDVVRIVADAEKNAVTGGSADVTFGWSVNIALRNVRGG